MVPAAAPRLVPVLPAAAVPGVRPQPQPGQGQDQVKLVGVVGPNVDLGVDGPDVDGVQELAHVHRQAAGGGGWLGFTGAGVLIYQSFKSWADSPIVTTIENLPIEKFTFP